MSDVVLASLIATLGGIVTAALTAFAPVFIEIIRQQFELKRRALELEEEQRKAKGGKGKKPGKGAQAVHKSPADVMPRPPKPKINWRLTGAIGFVSFIILFLVGMIILSAYTTPPGTAAVSLAAASVEFRITGNNRQIIIPAGGTLDALRMGDQVNIETQVTEAGGDPYPNQLTITYYFGSGANLTGNIAPYLARKSDTITVKIEDQVTGEVVTRFMLVSIWIELT